MTTTSTASKDSTPKQPNILFLMVDQLAAPTLPAYGHPIVKAPHISALAEQGVVFDSAYCNFPICAPSRFSLLSGRLPHAIEAYDNGSEFPASIPTMAHYLRQAGYRTTLCGKMHFIGPDQLHGYEERLTTDIYPADFAWTPDWLKGPAYRPTGVSMRGVVEAGPCLRSLQIDYDDEVEYHALQKLYDLARVPNASPFFLTVSFTHPHPPFVAPQQYWDMYNSDEIDHPKVPEIPFEQLDEHSQWLYTAHAQGQHHLTPERVRNARQAYYGMITYTDAKIGRIMQTLKELGLDDNTLVVLAGDHGEMLGERGMWYKQTFFEWSVRVPLIVSMPQRFKPGRVAAHVSLVDLLPTFLDISKNQHSIEPVDPLDGKSLLPLLDGTEANADRCVISEYSSEGVCAASRMVRLGRYKYIYTYQLAPMLFDLDSDPDELTNLAGQPAYASVQEALHAKAIEGWDPAHVHADILASQKRRLFIAKVNETSEPPAPNWAYQPFVDETKRYIRGSGTAGPMGKKAQARFPFVPPVLPDRKENM